MRFVHSFDKNNYSNLLGIESTIFYAALNYCAGEADLP